MWQSFRLVLSLLVFLSCIQKYFNATFFPWILLARRWLSRFCGVFFFLFKSMLIKKWSPRLSFVVQMIQKKHIQGHAFINSNPSFLRLLSEFGLHTIFTVAWKSPTSHFHIDWQLKIGFRHSELSAYVRLDCDNGRARSARPCVLHRRRRWQEFWCVCVRVCVWRNQILGTFFLLIGWLSKSSWLSHKARSDTRGNDPPSAPSSVQVGRT